MHQRHIGSPPVGRVPRQFVSRIEHHCGAFDFGQVDVGDDNQNFSRETRGAPEPVDRVEQVIETTEKEYNIKSAHTLRTEVWNVDVQRFHVDPQGVAGKLECFASMKLRIAAPNEMIRSKDARRAPPLRFEAIESVPCADVDDVRP